MRYTVEMASDGRYTRRCKFNEDWFGHSGNIKAAVLVLLMEGIYDVCRRDGTASVV
jgi:hypothetical protein